MAEHPVPRAPQSGQARNASKAPADAATATPEQQRALAHARGRICKVRGCEVCAPLRERRRLRKAQRKADAQALAHARGEACGRAHCPVAVCVTARHADVADDPSVAQRADGPGDDPDLVRRRQAERHRAGLACGSETCAMQVCIDGFDLERVRRHRARRPCRASECSNPICAASRTTT